MNEVVLFTSRGKSAFVDTEIAQLNLHFDKVEVVATTQVDLPWFKRLFHLFKFLWPLAIIYRKDLGLSRFKYLTLGRVRKNFSLLFSCSIFCEHYFKNKTIGKEIYYAYFTNDMALVLAFAKQRGYIKSFITRAHGRDVIEEREPVTKRLPFQWFKYQEVLAVYGISSKTRDYLKEKYPRHSDKFKLAYLGTKDLGIGPLEPEDETFVLVSVGRIRNVKRFYLIAEMLQHATKPIRWVHFGDYSEADPTMLRFHKAIEALTHNPNVSYEPQGFVPNDQILEYYSNNYVDCLFNSSEIEGLPVSIQEAISFGIPCVATDVGGTSDIVNEQTGVLLEKDFKPEETMLKVERFINEHSRNSSFRIQTRKFWMEHFQAALNYPIFFESLSQN